MASTSAKGTPSSVMTQASAVVAPMTIITVADVMKLSSMILGS